MLADRNKIMSCKGTENTFCFENNKKLSRNMDTMMLLLEI